MRVQPIQTGKLLTNSYLLTSEVHQTSSLIDPGDDAQFIFKSVTYPVSQIFLTHAHFDHIGAVDELFNILKKKQSTLPTLYIHRNDQDALADPFLNMSFLHDSLVSITSPSHIYQEGDSFLVGDDTLQVLHTPGHTQGSICLWNKAENLLFSGDTVFQNGYGRTDHPGGDEGEMRESLLRLRHLPPNTQIFPGHGPSETLKHAFTSQMIRPLLE